MKKLKLGLLLVAIVSALSVTSLALAQATNLYDLACWYSVNNGGGQRLSTTLQLRDSLGATGAGISSSQTVILRAGHIQNWYVAPVASPVLPSEPITGENLVFLSSVWSYVKQLRPC